MRCIVDDRAFTIEPVVEGKAAPGKAISWFSDDGFRWLSRAWIQASWQRKYSYQFNWLGRPIIQLPADVMMMQEIIVRTRPTLIIEAGIAHGGSVVLHASLLEMTHRCAHGPRPGPGRPHVVAIDIDIRPANRAALDAHPLRSMFTLIQGSSIDAATVAQARALIRGDDRVMVVLDSNHSRAHVAAELAAYGPLISPGCALVVMDGIMPDLANLPGGDPTWASDHPGPAVAEFLKSQAGREFAVDHAFDNYALTHSPGGVLLRREGPARE